MKSALNQAEKIAARWLKNKLLSREELRQRLRKKNFPSEIIEAVLQKAGPILNDELLAENLIEHYRREKLSDNLIAQKLIMREIPPEIISRLLPPEPSTNARSNISEIITQIFPRYQNLPIATARRRISNYLSRRGYSSEDVEDILQKFFPDKPEDI